MITQAPGYMDVDDDDAWVGSGVFPVLFLGKIGWRVVAHRVLLAIFISFLDGKSSNVEAGMQPEGCIGFP